MEVANYALLGGIHPETAAVRSILSFHGVHNPADGDLFSEAMLLGIGGGLGATYILWEFEKHGFPSIVLAFRNKANYPVKFLNNLCSRLGCQTTVLETAGRKKAAQNLTTALSSGQPAIIWLDLGSEPYYMHYLSVGVVVVFGITDEQVLVDGRARERFDIPIELMADARAKVPSFKNRLMTIQPGAPFEIKQAIRDGLTDCVDYLSASSTSFSLPALRKWARLMTDTKNNKGWPIVFADQRGLFGTLRTIYESVELIGTGGGALRSLYADFLQEAAPIVANDALLDAAILYRQLAQQWQAFAHMVLPDNIEPFRRTKQLLHERAEHIQAKGSRSLEEIAPLNDELHAIKGDLNLNFPMSPAAVTPFYEKIQAELLQILAAEKAALATLKSAASD